MKSIENDTIELRSEEVQELMGQVPPWILRWGIMLIGVLMAGLLTGSYFFRYPETLNAAVIVPPMEPPVGYACIPPTGAGKLKTGQTVKVRLENYPDTEYGYVAGRLDSIASAPDPNGQYRLVISFPKGMITNYGIKLPLHMQLVGTAAIITKDKRLIENFVQPIIHILKN